MPVYCWQRWDQVAACLTATRNYRKNMVETQLQPKSCRGCGSYEHGGSRADDRL